MTPPWPEDHSDLDDDVAPVVREAIIAARARVEQGSRHGFVRSGGFRSRHRVRYMRVICNTVRGLRWTLVAAADNEWEHAQQGDRRRVCPHTERREPLPGYIDCLQCGVCLRSPRRTV